MRNKDEDDEDKEEYVSAPLVSTEDLSPGNKDNEWCEYAHGDSGIYDHEDTVIYYAEDNKEEASSGHKGESSLSDLSESSDDEDEDDDGTSEKDIKYDGDGDKGDDRNIGARVGSAEWLEFLSLSTLMEALGAMAKAKAASLTALRKKLKVGKSNSELAQEGKTSQKLVKNLLKTTGRKAGFYLGLIKHNL